MKISTRGLYGTRALIDLVLHEGRRPILLKDIARRQQISVGYLEQLITPLIAAGILRSTRGPKGGISFARSPEEIKLSEVIQLLEGSIAPVECINNPDICNRSKLCAPRDVWNELKEAMDNILESINLKDLAERQRRKEGKKAIMYYI